jgi:excisionase family DNA binding protein
MPANTPGNDPAHRGGDVEGLRRRRKEAQQPSRARAESGTVGEMTFLTVAEVASLMRVSKMTVYRLVHSGTLPAVRVGRSFRVPENAVHDYLRSSFIEAG